MEIDESLFSLSKEKLSLEQLLNLIHLYLMVNNLENKKPNPARLLIAKCIYYYNCLSSPMIYVILCACPTVLPNREDRTWDRTDPLISVIQHILMSRKYDMNNEELKHRELLSKLRYEYHYEPFIPTREKLLDILLEKLRRGSNIKELSYAFALLCKQLDHRIVMSEILQKRLVPLANEWLNSTNAMKKEHNEHISATIECISMIIKPFPLEMDVTVYLALFQEFLNTKDPVIMEAAICAIIRLQRFGFVNCFNALRLFELEDLQLQAKTLAMLRTFICRKSSTFWRTICPDAFQRKSSSTSK